MRHLFRKIVFGVLALLLVGVGAPLTASAQIYTFNSNKIMDDSVFDNYDSMSASQIDAFLNSFPDSCISSNSGFTASAPAGYNPTNNFIYGSPVTAGHVIYDAAQAYQINPQVLLTMLELQQGLVDGISNSCGNNNVYAAAMGYDCLGSAHSYSGLDLYQRNGVPVTSVSNTCVMNPADAGFSQQVIHAAWLLKFSEQRSEGNINWAIIQGNWDNSDDLQTCYGGLMTEGSWQRCPSGPTVYYDGYASIDGTMVHIDNGATAALYYYTPHMDGNVRFFNAFTGWFGSMLSLPTINDLQSLVKGDLANDDAANGLINQLAEAGQAHQKGNDNQAQKLVEITIKKMNQLGEQGKLAPADANAYQSAAETLIASW
jgi:hypothetical protein